MTLMNVLVLGIAVRQFTYRLISSEGSRPIPYVDARCKNISCSIFEKEIDLRGQGAGKEEDKQKEITVSVKQKENQSLSRSSSPHPQDRE